MEKWDGCDGNCLECRYSECIAPVSKVWKKPQDKYSEMLAGKVSLIKKNRNLSIRQLSTRLGVPYATLRRFIRADAELDSLFPQKSKRTTCG